MATFVPSIAVRRFSLAGVAVMAATSGAIAQTARVDVSHDDVDGIVSPGETIRVTVAHSREHGGIPGGTFLGHVEGDLSVSPNIGQSGSLASPFIPAPGLWHLNPGVASGASLMGFEIDFWNAPMFIIGTLPWQWSTAAIDLFSFEWTAPQVATPTDVTFEWHAAPGHPLIEIYNNSQPFPFPIPTTYTSASIVVLPTPGVGAMCVVGGWLALRRRGR